MEITITERNEERREKKVDLKKREKETERERERGLRGGRAAGKGEKGYVTRERERRREEWKGGTGMEPAQRLLSTPCRRFLVSLY